MRVALEQHLNLNYYRTKKNSFFFQEIKCFLTSTKSMGTASATKKYVHFEHFTVITGRKGKPRGVWNTTTYDINPLETKKKIPIENRSVTVFGISVSVYWLEKEFKIYSIFKNVIRVF